MTMRWSKVLKEVNEVKTFGQFKTIDDLLKKLYKKYKFSTRTLAELCGCDPTTVRTKLIKLGVKLRERGGPNNRSNINITRDDWLLLNIKELAKKYGCHPTTAIRLTKKYH